jgi:hypothetical protein
MLVNVRTRLPSLPRFLWLDGALGRVGIETLDDEELRTLGKLWTEALLEFARERRAQNGTVRTR